MRSWGSTETPTRTRSGRLIAGLPSSITQIEIQGTVRRKSVSRSSRQPMPPYGIPRRGCATIGMDGGQVRKHSRRLTGRRFSGRRIFGSTGMLGEGSRRPETRSLTSSSVRSPGLCGSRDSFLARTGIEGLRSHSSSQDMGGCSGCGFRGLACARPAVAVVGVMGGGFARLALVGANSLPQRLTSPFLLVFVTGSSSG